MSQRISEACANSDQVGRTFVAVGYSVPFAVADGQDSTRKVEYDEY